MGAPTAGEIILLPFPFSDLSQSKVRPAICLADAGRDDWVFCQVTSNPFGDPSAIPLNTQDFATGGLQVASYARPGKLFTAHESLVIRAVATLTNTAFHTILSAVITLLQTSARP